MPVTFWARPVAMTGSALKANSSSARKPVMFWSKRLPASDETSMRYSEPVKISGAVRSRMTAVPT